VKFIVDKRTDASLTKNAIPGEIDVDFDNFMRGQAAKLGFSYLSEKQMPAFTEQNLSISPIECFWGGLNSRGI